MNLSGIVVTCWYMEILYFVFFKTQKYEKLNIFVFLEIFL